MGLFDDIDWDETANRTDKFLKNKLPHLILRSGRNLTDLSSPKLSLASSHSNGINHQEDLIVNGLEIEKAVKAVHETIFHCREISKTVLIDTYLKNYTPSQVVMTIPYEQAYFFKKIKPIAMIIGNANAMWLKKILLICM
jgi:ArpU family phage transcriptional regulator